MSQETIHDRIMLRSGAGRGAPPSVDGLVKPGTAWLRNTILAVVSGAAVAGIGLTAIQFDLFRNLISPASGAKRPVAPLPDTPFLAHAKQAGLTTCSRVFPVLGQLLTNGATYNLETTWNQTQPNDHSVQALVGMSYASQTYTGPAAGIVVTSPVGSSCEGTMMRVTPMQRTCQEVVSGLLQGSRQANAVGPIAVYTLANNGGQVLLIPSDRSCVVVSVQNATG